VPFTLHVQYGLPRKGVPAPASFRRWGEAAAARCGAAGEVTLRVVDREEGADLNTRYRGKAGATNVLSFPFEAPPGVQGPWLGDVVICAPVVLEEARVQGKLAGAHWAHLLVHGMLHLLGHDHRFAAEAAKMERLEVEVLRSLGFEDPYA
jgi:probable rRNA maturation factor